MSEQKLREGLGEIQIKHPYALESYWRWIDEALSAEPDVVTLLRWLLSDAHTWFSGRTEPHITLSHEAIESYFAETFHIRLTDDGWEWID